MKNFPRFWEISINLGKFFKLLREIPVIYRSYMHAPKTPKGSQACWRGWGGDGRDKGYCIKL